MIQFGGKDSKRHFTVVMGGKEHGLYVSSSPSSAAKKAVTKLCTANKSKKVEFHIREITQGSKKKTYGSYKGYIEKLKEPIELKGRVIRYKPVAKLSGKVSKKMKGGAPGNDGETYSFNNLNRLSTALPYTGELNLSGVPVELTRRQKRIKNSHNRAHAKEIEKEANYEARLAVRSENERQQGIKRIIEKNIKIKLNEVMDSIRKIIHIPYYEYFSDKFFIITFPQFYLLSTKKPPSVDSQYFLTFIDNKYVAFHITNIERTNKGTIFIGPTDNFEEFKKNVGKFFRNGTINSDNSTKKSIDMKLYEGKYYPTFSLSNS